MPFLVTKVVKPQKRLSSNKVPYRISSDRFVVMSMSRSKYFFCMLTPEIQFLDDDHWWNFVRKRLNQSRLKSTVWSTDSDSWVKKVTFIKHIQKFQKRTKLVLNLDVTISSLTCNTKIVILIGNLYSEYLKEKRLSG